MRRLNARCHSIESLGELDQLATVARLGPGTHRQVAGIKLPGGLRQVLERTGQSAGGETNEQQGHQGQQQTHHDQDVGAALECAQRIVTALKVD